jgi:peptidyl-prolyl cis-trans isomerase C
MNFKAKNLIATAWLVMLAFGASAQEPPKANTVLATVDGVNITVGHVIALRGRLPQQYQDLPDDVLFEGIIEQLIQQTVLMNAIKRVLDDRTALGLENEKRAFLASEMMARLTEREVTEEELQQVYLERYDAAIPDQEYNASHVLVATLEEAVVLIGLLDDGAEFATIAREYSTGPSGPNGGSLGWFGKGAMVPEFEDAVVKLAIGENSPPVETQFGFHVVHLNDMRNKSVPTFDEVRPQLAMELQQNSVEQEILRLTSEAEVARTEVNVDPAVIRDVSLFD